VDKSHSASIRFAEQSTSHSIPPIRTVLNGDLHSRAIGGVGIPERWDQMELGLRLVTIPVRSSPRRRGRPGSSKVSLTTSDYNDLRFEIRQRGESRSKQKPAKPVKRAANPTP
jgi:hypothetical protein